MQSVFDMHTVTAKEWRANCKAAAEDDAKALWYVGSMYHYGARTSAGKVLVGRDSAKARQFFQRAGDLGDTSAWLSLAELSSEAGDAIEEMRCLRRAMALGEATGAYNLGICYRDLGQLKRAHFYYQKALAMGELGAHLQLGLCAMLGLGTAQDFKAACRHFEMIQQAPANASLAPRDREDALHWLALLNLLGLTGRRNLAKAQAMLLKADADRDHDPSGDLLNVLGRTQRR